MCLWIRRKFLRYDMNSKTRESLINQMSFKLQQHRLTANHTLDEGLVFRRHSYKKSSGSITRKHRTR